MSVLRIKSVEVPKVMNPLDRQQAINRWVEDLQRNNITVISIRFERDTEDSAVYTVEYLSVN